MNSIIYLQMFPSCMDTFVLLQGKIERIASNTVDNLLIKRHLVSFLQWKYLSLIEKEHQGSRLATFKNVLTRQKFQLQISAFDTILVISEDANDDVLLTLDVDSSFFLSPILLQILFTS